MICPCPRRQGTTAAMFLVWTLFGFSYYGVVLILPEVMRSTSATFWGPVHYTRLPPAPMHPPPPSPLSLHPPRLPPPGARASGRSGHPGTRTHHLLTDEVVPIPCQFHGLHAL